MPATLPVELTAEQVAGVVLARLVRAEILRDRDAVMAAAVAVGVSVETVAAAYRDPLGASIEFTAAVPARGAVFRPPRSPYARKP